MTDFQYYFEPQHYIETIDKNIYTPLQWGSKVKFPINNNYDYDSAEIIIVGCGEYRGDAYINSFSNNIPNLIREQFYNLHCWHNSVQVFDAGNIIAGKSLNDTKIALRTVLEELNRANKIVILLGGSHDLSVESYKVFKNSNKLIQLSVVDMCIDINDDVELINDQNFLMPLLTDRPNYIEHYNHIAFQSYFVNPTVLETLDKIRFDLYRLGRVRENIEEMEPVIRNNDMLSFDVNSISKNFFSSNTYKSINGLSSEEVCAISRYAGMSESLSSFNILGFKEKSYIDASNALVIAQMIWYFIDGYTIRKFESPLDNKENFTEYNIIIKNDVLVFIKSKKTNRWWMLLKDTKYLPCSYLDYKTACNNEIPERWLRAHERI